ncbi:DUF5684 domain-containing protein [Lysinibacter sp. HNR]|uniref:DUF5684 domain-containing protein n=1 Tax=Lysinibacter sp. HNR TaxID=3031408 RepID=UPI0024350A05|nr:DUF5684 domain-containing protein [Lysinibacter sp. HNR]WGD36342.1 DUF5684 domain-containing protein [Lysinibacter sp. HNR]
MITRDASFLNLLQANGWVTLTIYVLIVIGLWRVFTKAGQPGWVAIIPIVNTYFLLKVGGKPWWWLLLFLIPIVNLVLAIILAVNVGRNFDKGGAFSFFLLWLLAPIGYLILGFGSSTYRKVN